MSRWASTIKAPFSSRPRITCVENLYVVIMKSFTMNKDTLKPAQSPGDLARDESGRLYSVRMRELFDPLEVDMSVVEAMAALRIAGRALHHLQEKWAEKHGLSEGRLCVLVRLYRCGPTPLRALATGTDS